MLIFFKIYKFFAVSFCFGTGTSCSSTVAEIGKSAAAGMAADSFGV
jgi:hypothetical protein